MVLRTPPYRRTSPPLLYDYFDFQANPLAFWLEVAEIAPVVRIRLTSLRQYWVVTEPELLQEILQKKAKIYVRDRRLMNIGRMGRPSYSFNTDSWEDWLWRRRLMQPAFHRQQIAHFADVMVAQTQRIVQEWQAENKPIELATAIKDLTMRIIGRTMFSFEMDEQTDILHKSYELGNRYVYERTTSAFNIPHWLPLPLTVKYKNLVSKREAMLADVIMERHQSQEPKNDLLDMLLDARLEDGRQFTVGQLVQEMNGIVFAGHDTTAMTLTWLFYLLSQHPDIEAKLVDEIETVLGDKPPTLSDLDNLPYTEAVINETMRCYPPVYATIRETIEDDILGETYHVPKSTSLVVNIRGIHHHSAYWDDPRTFNPERFMDDKQDNAHRYTFIPFIGGPRKCMGDMFAMMEMKLVVPTLLQAIRLHYIGQEKINPLGTFVLSQDKPVMMEVQNS